MISSGANAWSFARNVVGASSSLISSSSSSPLLLLLSPLLSVSVPQREQEETEGEAASLACLTRLAIAERASRHSELEPASLAMTKSPVVLSLPPPPPLVRCGGSLDPPPLTPAPFECECELKAMARDFPLMTALLAGARAGGLRERSSARQS